MTASEPGDTPVDLDPVDWAILEQLQADSNISNKDLAAQIGLAASTCLERVRRLRERGVITGFHAEVSPAAVGLGLQAILTIQVRPHARDVFAAFVDFVLGLPETRAIYHVSGDADFLLHVATVDSRHLQHLVLDVISLRPELAQIQSSIIFEQVMMSALGPPQPGAGLPPLVARRARVRAATSAEAPRIDGGPASSPRTRRG
jgi:DNA-binding Lrp family transcriptional regulator